MHILVNTEKPLEESVAQILSQEYSLECLQTAQALGDYSDSQNDIL